MMPAQRAKAHHLVYGYVRALESTLPNHKHIPLEITDTISVLFYEYDQFDRKLCGELITLSDDNRLISTDGKRKSANINSTVYGHMVIYPLINKTCIWRFRNLAKSTAWICIGIDCAEAKWINSTYQTREARETQKAMYAFHGFDARTYSWNEECRFYRNAPKWKEEGDILTMTLKFTPSEQVLSYKVNDGEELITHSNILREESLNYRMAISVFYTSTISVELLDFTVMYEQ